MEGENLAGDAKGKDTSGSNRGRNRRAHGRRRGGHDGTIGEKNSVGDGEEIVKRRD